MKSALVCDCEVNAAKLPEYLRLAMQWRFVGKTLTAYLPQGTVFDAALGAEVVELEDAGRKVEIPQPVFLVMTGQAAAGDEECAVAAGMTPEQAKRQQRLYLSALAGIQGENDLELFMSEVIDGYDTSNPKHSNQSPVYKPGKFYKAYAEALEKTRKAGDLE